MRPPPGSTLFPYTTLFRSRGREGEPGRSELWVAACRRREEECPARRGPKRSEEHTSELQSLRHLVCRLLLEKKKREVIGDRSGGDASLAEIPSVACVRGDT